MSELTDLEIERRIADIEGVHYIETKYDKDNFLALVSENDFTGTPPEMIGKYNPLTDNALIWHLMDKHDIDVSRAGFRQGTNEPVYCAKKHDSTAELVFSRDRKKAVALAIIEANNG